MPASTIQIQLQPLEALLASLPVTQSTSEQQSAQNAMLIAASLAGALDSSQPKLAERLTEVIGLSPKNLPALKVAA